MGGEVAQRGLLDRGAGEPQLLPVLDLGDDRGALVADGAGGVGEVAPQLGVAERLARGGREGRHPDEGAGHGARLGRRRRPSTRLGVLGGGEDLGEVHDAYAGPLARQHPADVHQAGVVAGDQHLGAGVADVPRLVGAHRDRGVGVLQGEGAAEAAALLGVGQVDQGRGRAPPRAAARPVADAEHPQRVAGRVVGHPVREVGADVGHAEHVDEELAELVGPRRRSPRRPPPAPGRPTGRRRSSAGAAPTRRTSPTASRRRRTPRRRRRRCAPRAPPRRGSRC